MVECLVLDYLRYMSISFFLYDSFTGLSVVLIYLGRSESCEWASSPSFSPRLMARNMILKLLSAYHIM